MLAEKPIHHDPLKLLISFLVLIGLFYGGLLALDLRYLEASDAKQQFKVVNDSLNRIYIQQLKTEAREIIKDFQWRKATNTEQIRLQEIAELLQKLGSTWKVPKPK